MRVDSLEMLQTLFETWRKEKRYDHERIPDVLMAQARKAVAAHGLPAVIRATRITRARLEGVKGAKTPCRAKSSRRIPRSAGALIPVAEIQVPGS